LESEGFRSSPWHVARAESLLSRRFFQSGGTKEQYTSLRNNGILLPGTWHSKRADGLVDRRIVSSAVSKGVPEGTAKKAIREIRKSGKQPSESAVVGGYFGGGGPRRPLLEISSITEYRKALADMAAGLAYYGEDVQEYEEWVSSIDY
jgi:hypothetical protein